MEAIKGMSSKVAFLFLGKSLLLALWNSRYKWLYPGVIIGGALAYLPLKNEFIGMEVHGLHISNMTTNLWVMVILWLWFVPDISSALWSKIKRRKAKAPAWFHVGMLISVILGLIYYLTLWGYETRW